MQHGPAARAPEAEPYRAADVLERLGGRQVRRPLVGINEQLIEVVRR
jgi:hypothetical protein